MKRSLSILAIILLIVLGCSESKRSEVTADCFITVDVTAKYPKKELILQDIFDIEYIPLETNDEFITAANIHAIGKDIIISKNTGRTDGTITMFDREGKGIRMINRLGQGNEEYTNILGIILDEENEEIYVNNHYSRKIVVYDLLGNFKRSIRHKENGFYELVGNFDRDYLICHINPPFEEKPDIKDKLFVLVSKQDGSIKDIPIPYKEFKSTMILKRDNEGNITNNWGIRNRQLIPRRDGWLIIEPSADTIYSYSQDQKLKPFIVRTPSVQSMDPEVFLFPSVLTDRYYFMQAVAKKFNFGIDKDVPRTDLVYDKQENSIFECVIYNSDFTDKIPVNIMLEIFMLNIVNNDEIAFTRKLEPFDLVEAYKEGKLKGRLKDIAAELDEESNGVIMVAKYKR